MTTLSRQPQKLFAGSADADQIAVFGSMKTGTPVYSTSLATLQSTEYTEGWSEAILDDKAPYLEEMNAVQYGLSYQIAYLLQEGIPEYDANTNYSATSIVKTTNDNEIVLYRSLQDDNFGNALTNATYWQPYLYNLANIDLSNLTDTGKTKIATIAHKLDWTNAISITTTSSSNARNYTPLKDGLLCVSCAGSGNTNATKYIYATIRDSSVRINGSSIVTAVNLASSIATASYYVLANTTYSYEAWCAGFATNSVNVIFVPLKKD